MRNLKLKRIAFFLCLGGIIIICLAFLLGTARSVNNQIAISKDTDFIPDDDPNEVYNHILFKIRPYKTFRLALNLLMDDDTTLWIYYKTTSAESFKDYESGNIHIGLDAAYIDSKPHIIDRDICLDIENFVVSRLRAIKKVEILGERFDLYYIIAYRDLDDGTRSNITIDNFDEPGQDISDRGWKSTTMDQFSISFDLPDMIGYLKAKYTPETTPEDPNDTEQQPVYPYYVYPYGGYYGNTLYGGYYGGTTSYYGSSLYGGYYGGGYYGGGYYGGGYYGGGYYGGGYYGGGYYGGGYYGGGYYGGGYYGGGYYGSGYYGSGYYGGGGYYGGLYGGLGYYGGLGGYYGGLYGGQGLYGGLYGLSNYYGGPIGLLGGLTGLFI